MSMGDKKRIKGITCCGDCVYYNFKKHKCTRGASVETNAKDHFYDDCPIPDVEQLDADEIRNKAIDEFVAKAEEWNNNIKSIRNEDGFFTIENIRKIAEKIKGE